MLIITTHYWGDKYSAEYVRKLARGLKRNITQPYRFMVITDAQWRFANDDFETARLIDTQLMKMKGCFCRLRLFDPLWQLAVGIEEGDQIVSFDLDLIITGTLDPVFDRKEDFVILQGVNSSNPCPYNGSIFMLRAGEHEDVWNDFSIDKIPKIVSFEFPDDQGWFHYKIPNAAAWGPSDGVYAFQKVGWPKGTDLPENAKIVAFPGWRDPSLPMFKDIPWIKANWK